MRSCDAFLRFSWNQSERRASGVLLLQLLFRSLDDVCQQHRARHRANTAGHRRNKTGNVADPWRYVADEACVSAGNANIEYRCTWLHHVCGDEPSDTSGRHDDVRVASVGGQVTGTRVTKSDGRVFTSPCQQQAQRAADRNSPTDDAHLRAVEVHVVPAKQFDDAARSAGKRSRGTQYESPQVHRMQPVGVFARVHPFEHSLLIDSLGQWKLHDVAGTRRIVIESINVRENEVFGGIGR